MTEKSLTFKKVENTSDFININDYEVDPNKPTVKIPRQIKDPKTGKVLTLTGVKPKTIKNN